MVHPTGTFRPVVSSRPLTVRYQAAWTRRYPQSAKNPVVVASVRFVNDPPGGVEAFFGWRFRLRIFGRILFFFQNWALKPSETNFQFTALFFFGGGFNSIKSPLKTGSGQLVGYFGLSILPLDTPVVLNVRIGVSLNPLKPSPEARLIKGFHSHRNSP